MELKENMEKEVIKVIMIKKNIISDASEKKKSVIIFGLEEKTITENKEKEETKTIKEILKKQNDEAEETKFKIQD